MKDSAALKRENAQLRAALEKTIAWLDRLTAQSETQVKLYRGRFNSLADACQEDATNYRATATDLRKTLE